MNIIGVSTIRATSICKEYDEENFQKQLFYKKYIENA